MTTLAAGIPSPTQGTWYLGPFPLRAYALAILIGGILAYVLLVRRYRARGGPEEQVGTVVTWAVVMGIIGARIYHVITSPDAYFGPDGDLKLIPQIWNGGLGIWGAISLGAVGAWIGLRRAGLRFAPFADALAPGLLVAQAVGRIGNYFNQELYGRETTLPWGLQIDRFPDVLFHPTFLYELIWNLVAAAALIAAERRFRLGHGRVFLLYVVLYTAGRGVIESLRIDEAQLIAGLRLNVWTSILVGVAALVAFVVVGRRHPGGRTGEAEEIWLPGRAPEPAPESGRGAGAGAGAGTAEEAGDGDPEALVEEDPLDAAARDRTATAERPAPGRSVAEE
ncbi:prolipoprotein diacylglyceryl transferase [Litorihabitans aurantiacus]|uniref:Phosphatidylglycerol--prolipoprotein diacylglyceryl transferase n=1 Tax=Litorihabitans aurantiacus TaxID=1930061 RepID=A0AA37UX01_9MICO|nr:prolipoprotein diacylglyceryl transferase [Litorihabitans aurantiacus]GMA31132.1 prolipoprotein diacylglyceryl transferase 2 [Litorihabitans aurantiacus]